MRATARIPIPSFLDSFLKQRIVRVSRLGTNPPFQLLAETHPNPSRPRKVLHVRVRCCCNQGVSTQSIPAQFSWIDFTGNVLISLNKYGITQHLGRTA